MLLQPGVLANFKVWTWFSNDRMPKTDIFLINVASSAIYWGFNVPGMVLGTPFASAHVILTAVLHWLVLPHFTSEDNEAEKVNIMPQILYWVINKIKTETQAHLITTPFLCFFHHWVLLWSPGKTEGRQKAKKVRVSHNHCSKRKAVGVSLALLQGLFSVRRMAGNDVPALINAHLMGNRGRHYHKTLQ